MKHAWISGLLITLVLLSGCSSSNIGGGFSGEISEKEKEFRALYPDVDMNHAIVPSDDTQPFDKTHGDISIGITNTSNHRICFPVDFNVSVLSYEETREWKELNNLITYLSVKDIVLEPSGNIQDFNNIIVSPDLENDVHQISEIRIVIWGKICGGLPRGKKEGAYIDVKIE